MYMACVIANDGTKLMPCINPKKVRKLLKSKRAKILKYRPFTIQLLYESEKGTQPIEFKEDTGYLHIGVSNVSQKHEYVAIEAQNLDNEVERHNDCRKYRRARRNRKRYRKARFDNRKKPEGWIAPSLVNKAGNHINLFGMYYEVMPITKGCFEIGQFDTQILKAIAEDKPLPEGTDYQKGEQYGYDTLREAVFARDHYKCIVCGKSAIHDGIILRMHHLGYWRKDRTNRMPNLASVCTCCHTAKNHQPDGKLYGLGSRKGFSDAAFMNTVKYFIVQELKKRYPDVEFRVTFGAETKRKRLDRNLPKSHANDAYCMGDFQPKHRSRPKNMQKRRRNNRIMEKFYDAKYIDIRDGKVKKGSQLGCNRTNRREPRNSDKNERIYHGKKISKGKRVIREKRYAIQPGDVLEYDGRIYTTSGCHNKDTRVILKVDGKQKSIAVSKVKVIRHAGGWIM